MYLMLLRSSRKHWKS